MAAALAWDCPSNLGGAGKIRNSTRCRNRSSLTNPGKGRQSPFIKRRSKALNARRRANWRYGLACAAIRFSPNTLRLRLDPQGDASGLGPGVTVWIAR